MSLRSMPIATRAALSFALITALLVITGIFSLNRMGSLNEASSDISDNWLPSVRESAELNVLLAELRQVQLAHVLAADDSSKRFLESRMTEIGKELTDREGAYQRLISGADERSIYERYLATRQTLLQSQQTLVQMSRSKPLEETRQYTESTLLDQYRATQQQLQALIDFNVKGASQASHTADEVYHSAFAAVIGVLLVAGLATVVLAWLFTRSITQPLGEALRVAEVIASGDLTSRIDTSGRDEPAKLLVALQGMQAQLRQTIQQIGSSATQLASAAEELSAVTEQGNRSLTQQNDEIQMAATAVNEMTAAAGDDEAVTLGVVGAGGLFRRLVVLGGEGAHGVEQAALAPVFLFAAAGEDHVLLAQLDLFHGLADAMRAGGAGGGDRVVDALDLERRGQAGRYGAAHGAGHAVWADALDAFLAQGIDGFHLVQGGSAAGAGDQAGAGVGNLFRSQAGVLDRLLHRQVGVGGGIAHEAEDLAIDQLFEVQVDRTGNVAAQAHLGVGRIEANAGPTRTEVGGNGVFVIAEAGNDAQTGDNDATHADNP